MEHTKYTKGSYTRFWMFMANPYVALHYFFDGSIPAFASDKLNEISLIDDLVIGFWIIIEPIIVFDMFL